MHFLIDYENVHDSGFKGVELLGKDDRVVLFFSENCKTINEHFLDVLRKNGSFMEVRQLRKQGKDALDRYIDIEAGRIIENQNGNALIGIVSNDKGFYHIFDYSKLYATGSKITCKRNIAQCVASLRKDIDLTEKAKPYNCRILINDVPKYFGMSSADDGPYINKKTFDIGDRITIHYGGPHSRTLKYTDGMIGMVEAVNEKTVKVRLDKKIATAKGEVQCVLVDIDDAVNHEVLDVNEYARKYDIQRIPEAGAEKKEYTDTNDTKDEPLPF